MTRFFTALCTERQFKFERGLSSKEGPLDHTAGNMFRKRGISRGDFVYVLSNLKGVVYLLGRLKVEAIVSREEAERRLGKKPRELYDAEDHLLADPGQFTQERFDREIPNAVLHHLEFLTASGEIKTLRFNNGHLDQQTLRTLRELTLQSAALLDRIVQPPSEAAETDRGQEDTEDEDHDGIPEEDEPQDDPSPSHPTYLRQAALRRAVELRAVEAASAHYSDSGYKVENTSATQPYDLCCRKGSEELRVEVKGSQGEGNEIFLTSGEVEHARNSGVRTGLFVWGNIEIVGDGTEVSGVRGRLAFHRRRWIPAEET